MSTPSQFYKEALSTHSAKSKAAQKSLTISSTLRLLVFLGIGVGVYFTFGNGKAMAGVLIPGVALFLFLVKRHTNLRHQRAFFKALIAINETELKVQDRDFYHLESGTSYEDPTHVFSQDIDLFGRGSFFQYANRTALESGRALLAKLLLANSISDIQEKQEAIKELSKIPEWRQEFAAMAYLVKTEVPAHTVISWLQSYEKFIPSFGLWLSRLFSIGTALVFLLYFLDVFHGAWVFGWFVLGLLISARYLGKIGKLTINTGKIQSTFDQYYKLLLHIEEQEMKSSMLSRKRSSIITSSQKASDTVKRFSRHLDALDQRNNILVGIIANGFFLRDIGLVYHIEKWIVSHRKDVRKWFDVIAFFDAYNSLGNFTFNHPDYIFPTITKSGAMLMVKGVAHPLLDPKVAVRNDITMNADQFFIITGANMAGKSTFLRTVALQIVMANVGLPVCALQSSYTPIKLITSMRTTDSLTDDESYFFSELKRLKFIVDEIKNDRYFIILDEILKGTNSTDKATGSRKFIDKLVGSHSTGIIATHDLSLTKAADDLETVENYYFDAQIVDGELFFDYTFKEGVCQNMNASFLLKKMGIVD